MSDIKNLSASTKFKNTPIGEIPVDWGVVRLGEVVSSVQSGVWGDKPQPNEISFPVIRSTEITHDCKIDLATVEYRKVPEDKINKYKLKKGDILIVSSSGSPQLIGRVAQFKHNANDKKIYLFSNFMIKIRPQGIDSTFLFYYLNSYSYFCFLKNLQQTSTGLRNLPRTELINFHVPLPSLPEQEKIAAVLTSVDDNVEKNQQLIEQTKILQKALIQELLMKGLPGLHKEFKKTKLGEIPADWEIARLEKVVSDVEPGFACGERDDNGIVQLRINNIGMDGYIVTDDILKVPVTQCEIEKYKLKYGDILFNNTNSPNLIGKSAIFRDEVANCVYSNHLTRIRVNQNRVSAEWLILQLIRLQSNGYFEGLCNRHVCQAGLSKQDILTLQIILSALSEQNQIIAIITSLEKHNRDLLSNAYLLETLKQGLMQVLLSGRIRIKDIRV